MNRIAELKAANEDDLYSGYNEYPSTFDIRNLENDEIFQAARRKSSHERKNLVNRSLFLNFTWLHNLNAC